MSKNPSTNLKYTRCPKCNTQAYFEWDSESNPLHLVECEVCGVVWEAGPWGERIIH